MKKLLSKCNLQTSVVALCILAVCIGTQQMQTMEWNSGKIEFFRDALGVWMALILFTHYKWSDFVKYKIPYIVWSAVGGAGILAVTPIFVAKRHDYLAASTIILALGIFLMGYCVIHTAISFFVEKYRPKLYKPLLMIWVVMFIWMIFSESEYLWPECYFVMFLCYYLTEQTPTQRTNVIKGIVNGVILGFLVIQGHAFLCRPYDRVRYYGNFCNPNHNCAFLCICLVAILAKILFLTREKQRFMVKAIFFLMAGVCYSFICMTVCRSGYLTTVVVTVFFLLAYCKVRGKKVFVRTGALLVLLFAVMLPVSYFAVRYLPTVHPYVLFYYQEQYSEQRVHSWDERDSEKFVSFQEMMNEIFGRFSILFNDYDELKGEQSTTSAGNTGVTFAPFALRELQTASVDPAVTDEMLKYIDPETGEIDPDKIPKLEEETNAFLVRYTIYKWYIEHLSLRGMPYDEQGFQLTSTHWIQDTHNIYLDYGINFGIPAMLLFAVFVWWGIGRLTRQGLKKGDVEKLTCLLFVLVPPVFGLLEFAWGTGTLSTVTFYLAFKEFFAESREAKTVVSEEKPFAANGNSANP